MWELKRARRREHRERETCWRIEKEAVPIHLPPRSLPARTHRQLHTLYCAVEKRKRKKKEIKLYSSMAHISHLDSYVHRLAAERCPSINTEGHAAVHVDGLISR